MHAHPSRPLSPIWALLGPAAVGLAVGITSAESPGLKAALLLPAVVGGVLALTTPALYIGSAFAGLAPQPRVLLGAMQSAMRDAGLVLAGLAPALLFLAATAQGHHTPVLLTLLVMALGALIGLRLLYTRLFAETALAPDEPITPAIAVKKVKALGLFTAWSAVVLGIGVYLLISVLVNHC